MSGAPAASVNFWSPQGIIAPDLTVEQQQIERNRALAQTLMSQSLQNDIPQRGAYSWTQGAAKLTQGLAAALMNRRADRQQADLNRTYAGRMGPMFGGGQNPDGTMSLPGGTTGQPTAGAVSAGTAQSSLPAAPTTATPKPAFNDQLSGIPADKSASSGQMDIAFSPAAMEALQSGAPMPPIAPAQSQPQDQPQPSAQPALAAQNAGWHPGPLSLTGDPQADLLRFSMDPQEYLKQVFAANAPTDFTKLLRQSNIDPNSPIGRMLMQGQVFKQNYIAPPTFRAGSYSQDPVTGQMSYHPQIPEGGEPVYDGRGNVVGVKALDGSLQMLQASEAARAAGRNQFEPITGYDASGQPVFTNKTSAATGGNGGAIRPELSPGYKAASTVTGTNSAQAFQQISDMAADAPNRIYALRQMQGLVNDPRSVFGPGSPELLRAKGIFGTLTGDDGPPSVTNAAEFNKWAAQYSARAAQDLGLSGSDARMQIVVHASPNGEMTKDALRAVLPQFIGFETARLGKAYGSVAWQQAHGPDTVQQYRTTWNRVFDPRLYAWAAEGPQAMAAHLNNLSRNDAIALRNKYLTLKQIGAFPQ